MWQHGGPGGYYTKWKSQSQKDKYCMITLLWGFWNKFLKSMTETAVTKGQEEGDMGRHKVSVRKEGLVK